MIVDDGTLLQKRFKAGPAKNTVTMAQQHGSIPIVASAFGPKTSLYDALQCDPSATSVELKRAYRRVALLYHPDKVQARLKTDDVGALEKAKEKFQAVSAAYEILQSPDRRALYDASGIVEEESPVSRSAAKTGNQQQQRWKDFFQSVFQEMSQHSHGDAKEYRGSEQEREDVIQYYKICKGNFAQVVDCLIHGEEKDIPRWKRDIIGPALREGTLAESVGAAKSEIGQKPKKRRLQKVNTTVAKKKKIASPPASVLDDTDEEDDQALAAERQQSRKNKMEYRVAKKRKLKAQREMEVARIIGSKSWSGTAGSASARPNRAGTFSNSLLLQMEEKYSRPTDQKKRLKKKKK